MRAKFRHIRHDWREFGNWPQKSCSTACGMKSTYNNCGIPGFDADEFWCLSCVRTVMFRLHRIEKDTHEMTGPRALDPLVAALYERVSLAIADQFEEFRAGAERDRIMRLAKREREQNVYGLTQPAV